MGVTHDNANRFEGRGPFFMVASELEDSAGIIVSGRVQRGGLAVGDKVDIYDQTGKKGEAVAQILKIFGKPLPDVAWRDHVSITLSGLQPKDINEGDFLAQHGSIELHKRIKVRVKRLPESEGGTKTPVLPGRITTVHVGLMHGEGKMDFRTDSGVWRANEEIDMEIELNKPVMIENNPGITMLNGGQVYARGVVIDQA